MSKLGADPSPRTSSEDGLRLAERHPACRQHEARSGSDAERVNLAGYAKGKGASGCNREAESTDAPERGGLPRSSNEGSVMGLERRRWVIAADLGQPSCRWREPSARREEPLVQWRPAGLARWHEPDESRGSSPDVRPAKAGMFSRRQTCRGKSQEPRSLDSRVAGNQDPEAYRQGLPRGDHEPPGRNDSERECGLEIDWNRGPSPHP
jgi:hypothetical protein